MGSWIALPTGREHAEQCLRFMKAYNRRVTVECDGRCFGRVRLVRVDVAPETEFMAAARLELHGDMLCFGATDDHPLLETGTQRGIRFDCNYHPGDVGAYGGDDWMGGGVAQALGGFVLPLFGDRERPTAPVAPVSLDAGLAAWPDATSPFAEMDGAEAARIACGLARERYLRMQGATFLSDREELLLREVDGLTERVVRRTEFPEMHSTRAAEATVQEAVREYKKRRLLLNDFPVARADWPAYPGWLATALARAQHRVTILEADVRTLARTLARSEQYLR